jgi:D-glycero-D-manno-heptose 1,7-bisphosphate phosphatase
LEFWNPANCRQEFAFVLKWNLFQSMERNKNISVFLDRDGTICEEVGYLRSPDQVRLLPGAAEAIRLANGRGIKTVVITNQSGVARGLFTEDQLQEIHRELARQLQNEGAFLDRIYFCPHHPSEGEDPYRRACDCRKPASGMVLRAASEMGIDLERSYCVGDRHADLECGMRVGTKGVLVLTGYGKEEWTSGVRTQGWRPSFVAAGLREAMEWIFEDFGGS